MTLFALEKDIRDGKKITRTEWIKSNSEIQNVIFKDNYFYSDDNLIVLNVEDIFATDWGIWSD